MQMLQFVLVFLHSIQTLYYDCNYPRVVAKVCYFVCSKILVNEKLFFKANDHQYGHILYSIRELLFLHLHHQEEGESSVDNTETAQRLETEQG